jgi:hypothetical protein
MVSLMDEKPRGSAGQFISEEKAKNITEEDLPELVHKSSTMTGALKDVKEAYEEKKLEEPLVAVKINNPLSWFMKVLNQLKKKQTTTITFRLGVPLIAIPVFVAALAGLFFGLGKITTKNEVIPTASPTPNIVMISKVGKLKVVRSGTNVDYFLILSGGDALRLALPSDADMGLYEGKRILASGVFDEANNILTVQKTSDMEVLIMSPKPIITQSPSPTNTETPTPIPSPTVVESTVSPSPTN